MTIFKGSCLCGEASFEYQSPSLWSAHCHCSLCRRAHGAAMVTWVGVAKARLSFTARETLKWYQSSIDGQRGFCSNCGSTFLFRSKRWPDEIHISRANIVGDLDIEPSAHVTYGSHKVPWFEFEDGLPCSDGSGN